MKGSVMTVLGPISPDELGITMTHEHLLIDLTCYMQNLPTNASLKPLMYEPLRLDNLWWVRQNPNIHRDNLLLTDVEQITGELMELKRFGGNSIVDVTSVGIGRDPTAIRNISIETGINVIMGSGYYFAASHPPGMSQKTQEEVTEEIISDIKEGVGETGIKSGIIGEIGISDIYNEPNEEKVLRAAVVAHKETGAPLSIHPALTRQCERIIEIIEEEGADLKRTIMSHTDLFLDESLEYTHMIADTGMYLEYDIWGREGNFPEINAVLPSDTQTLNTVVKLLQDGYIDQLLLSQDICWKIQLMSYGGTGYAHVLRDILPLFRHTGITEDEIRTMLVENPKRVLKFI